MIRKILIANRGEIAVRVMQTCRDQGIGTVAVYSTADAEALHVLRADEAVCIGPPPPVDSYLNQPVILRAAERTGADAVHPGYGFLAENADFAHAVQAAGLTWIGPPPEVITLMGDKMAAKDLAESVGVRTVPGYRGEDLSLARILTEAERLGYPVMLKAAAGGGGRGMRVVNRSEDLSSALPAAQREAASAFGDQRIFLEKLLVRPRHIEAQVLADSYGNAIYLGERDCSIQRRHQKVVEETPSPVMTAELRAAMGEAALRLVRASGYSSAGTVEFLFSGDQFYFLEMNTRIQVEHPITELTSGIDLVKEQIAIAAGERLAITQLEVRLSGHAIEARIYAENAAHGFLPATGTVRVLRLPEGHGVRNDLGVYQGFNVPPDYDPLLAKLIVHADSREGAIARLRNALEEYVVLGVTTNLDSLGWLASNPKYVAGNFDTGFVEREWQPEPLTQLPWQVPAAAAAFAGLSEPPAAGTDSRPSFNPWRQLNGWRTSGSARSFTYFHGGEELPVGMERVDESWNVTVAGETHTVRVRQPSAELITLLAGDRATTLVAADLGSEITIAFKGRVYRLRKATGPSLAAPRQRRGHEQASLRAPMPGTVVKVSVKPGQQVAPHEPLVVLEAMKMEHVIEAPHEGVVQQVLFREGDQVQAGEPMVVLEES